MRHLCVVLHFDVIFVDKTQKFASKLTSVLNIRDHIIPKKGTYLFINENHVPLLSEVRYYR